MMNKETKAAVDEIRALREHDEAVDNVEKKKNLGRILNTENVCSLISMRIQTNMESGLPFMLGVDNIIQNMIKSLKSSRRFYEL